MRKFVIHKGIQIGFAQLKKTNMYVLESFALYLKECRIQVLT